MLETSNLAVLLIFPALFVSGIHKVLDRSCDPKLPIDSNTQVSFTECRPGYSDQYPNEFWPQVAHTARPTCQ